MGGNMLWFYDASPVLAGDDVGSGARPLRIQVPVTIVQRTKLPNMLRYTKDKGYDMRPGDVVSVARRLDYQSTGVMQSIDVLDAHLTFLSDSDHFLVSIKYIDSYISDLPQIDAPITFIIKKSNMSLDSFNKIIGHEVFIVGGD